MPMKGVCILICFPFFLHLIQFSTNTCSYRHKSRMQAYLKTYTTYSTNCSLLVFIFLGGAQVMHTNCKILQQVWVVRLHGTLTTWTVSLFVLVTYLQYCFNHEKSCQYTNDEHILIAWKLSVKTAASLEEVTQCSCHSDVTVLNNLELRGTHAFNMQC